MGYPFLIAKRIIFNAQPSFSRFIIRLAVAATALSVATMVITLSLVNGFQKAVAEKVYSFWGHARVQTLNPFQSVITDDTGFPMTDSITYALDTEKDVVRYHGFAVKSVVLKRAGDFEGVLLKGVDSRFEAGYFQAFLKEGEFVSLKDSGVNNGVVLSATVAKRMQLVPGDTLQCLFIRNGEDIRSRPMVVKGVFKTGIEEYDNNFALCDIRFLRKLNFWENDIIGGVEVLFQKPEEASILAEKISEKLPYYLTALPLREIAPNIFDWLAIQNQTKTIVVLTMLVVAIINLVTCLLILVMERTRMVGVFKALGMENNKISRIFWVYAAWIAVVGIGMGLVIGVGLSFLQQATGFIKMDEATYYVSEAPVHMVPLQIAGVVLISFLVCVISIRLPLYYVQRISPIKAIRFE